MAKPKPKWLFLEKIDGEGNIVWKQVVRGYMSTVLANRGLLDERRAIKEKGMDGEYRAVLQNYYSKPGD